MLTTTISDFRTNVKKYLDKVSNNFETLIVAKDKNSGIVIMSLEEYNSINSTHYELSSKINEKRLDSAIEKLEKNNLFTKDLIEE